MREKIVVIGSMNYDIIMDVLRLPEKGETMPADGAVFTAGGKGANQAVQSAKLGISTYMVGCVGNDFMGDYLIKEAEGFGVDISNVRRVNQPSGMAAVHALKDGSVHATILRGANYEVSREDVDRIRPLLIESGVVVLQMEIPVDVTKYAIEVAKECGCKVLLNAAPAMELDDEHLRLCDIVVVNEVEAAYYCRREIDSISCAKEEILKITQKYGNCWIFTLGEMGAVVFDRNEPVFIKSHKVNAIETTGAGDSYIGGIGYGLIYGMDLVMAASFATSCSALTVCKMGAQVSMPVLGEVEKFRKTLLD